ncbi:MAG TPA: hypothetical protein DCF68_16675 [Cyanothece sp. UBA12306]|nr:hypothetical protein [Cyanothece sp. UBA12306]
MGLKIQEHTNPIALNTRWNSQAKANLVIERAQIKCGSDIGFLYKQNAYQLVSDDYDIRNSIMPDFKQQLGTNYAINVATKQGYRVLRQETIDGQVQITIGAKR